MRRQGSQTYPWGDSLKFVRIKEIELVAVRQMEISKGNYGRSKFSFPLGSRRQRHSAMQTAEFNAMPRRVTLLVTAMSLLTTNDRLCAGPFLEIVAFGDSMTDTGNVFQLTGELDPPSPPYFEGRFSNGPVWVEYLADRLQLPRPTPSLTGGSNFAYGGAQTGPGIELRDGIELPRVGSQIVEFLAQGGKLSDDTLVVVWAGFNDRRRRISNEEIVANLSDHVRMLHANGGQRFVLANLNNNWPAFNRLWWQEIDDLQEQLNISIARLDFVEFLDDVVANPSHFGFTNLAERALNSRGQVLPDPDK